jgi:hypothetical protein
MGLLDALSCEFEEFLKKEKDNFCKFSCLYSDGKLVLVDTDSSSDCKISPCDTCTIDDYIEETVKVSLLRMLKTIASK